MRVEMGADDFERIVNSDGETWEDWVERQFEDEYCAECNGDAEHHEPWIVMGNWFAHCKNKLRVPRADEIVVWPQDEDGGYLDAWNGWYGSLTEALTDAVGSVEGVAEGGEPIFSSPRTLFYGENLMSEQELDELQRR